MSLFVENFYFNIRSLINPTSVNYYDITRYEDQGALPSYTPFMAQLSLRTSGAHKISDRLEKI